MSTGCCSVDPLSSTNATRSSAADGVVAEPVAAQPGELAHRRRVGIGLGQRTQDRATRRARGHAANASARARERVDDTVRVRPPASRRSSSVASVADADGGSDRASRSAPGAASARPGARVAIARRASSARTLTTAVAARRRRGTGDPSAARSRFASRLMDGPVTPFAIAHTRRPWPSLAARRTLRRARPACPAGSAPRPPVPRRALRLVARRRVPPPLDPPGHRTAAAVRGARPLTANRHLGRRRARAARAGSSDRAAAHDVGSAHGPAPVPRSRPLGRPRPVDVFPATAGAGATSSTAGRAAPPRSSRTVLGAIRRPGTAALVATGPRRPSTPSGAPRPPPAPRRRRRRGARPVRGRAPSRSPLRSAAPRPARSGARRSRVTASDPAVGPPASGRGAARTAARPTGAPASTLAHRAGASYVTSLSSRRPARPKWAQSGHAYRSRRRTGRRRGPFASGRGGARRRGRRAPSNERFRQRPTLPGGLPPSTIGAGGLNGRVRDGNGCIPAAIATGNRSVLNPLENPIASTRIKRKTQALGRLVPVG